MCECTVTVTVLSLVLYVICCFCCKGVKTAVVMGGLAKLRCVNAGFPLTWKVREFRWW